MSFAQGSRSKLSLKAQPDFLTAASGNFVEVPFKSHSLDLNKSTVESGTVRSDREVSDSRHGQRQVGGSVELEMRYGDAAIELLMQSAMFNVWGSSEMTIGTQRTFLSIEDGQLDTGTYRLFTGCEVSRMAISVRPNEMVTASFDIAGRDMSASGSSSAGTTVAPSTNLPMDAFSGAVYDAFPASGAELGLITSLELNIDNGVQPAFVVGDSKAPFQEYGRGRVTGSMTLYLRDTTFINRYVNETEVPLYFSIVDPSGNDYLFYCPRTKYNGASVPHQSEQSRVVTVPFVALRGTSGVTSALRIQR